MQRVQLNQRAAAQIRKFREEMVEATKAVVKVEEVMGDTFDDESFNNARDAYGAAVTELERLTIQLGSASGEEFDRIKEKIFETEQEINFLSYTMTQRMASANQALALHLT